MGNILADKNGNVKYTIYDKIIKLYGKYNIIGRSVVIHENQDDLGRGGLTNKLATNLDILKSNFLSLFGFN